MNSDKIIDRWMLLLLAVLLTACSGDDKEGVSSDEDCYLDIYVYAPDRPIVTRSDVGMIEQRTAAESEVKSLQIWVFKHSDGTKVGYFGAGTGDANDVPNPYFLNETGQQVYRMKVDKAFADAPEAVDVYVVANAASCGLTSTGENPSLGANATRSQLDAAVIGANYFGTTNLYNENDLLSPNGRIYTNGLPMSAVAKNQPVFGSFPALRIGSETEMTTLQLTRAVSKLRFVLCRIKEEPSSNKKLVSIDDISLDANIIPTQSYLIPRESYSYTCSHSAISYGSVEKNNILEVTDPLAYAYETQSAQEYENLINTAITNGTLKEFGLTYFRESDKQLTGTITYSYNENNAATNTQATATFSMAAPGDFLRNHSWIIYVYYMDSKIYTLTVTHIGMKSWVSDLMNENKPVYNW